MKHIFENAKILAVTKTGNFAGEGSVELTTEQLVEWNERVQALADAKAAKANEPFVPEIGQTETQELVEWRGEISTVLPAPLQPAIR